MRAFQNIAISFLCGVALGLNAARAESLASPENVARKEALERAERLAIFVIMGFDKVVTMEHQALHGQFVLVGGSVVERGERLVIETGGTVRLRIYLNAQDQAKLGSLPIEALTASVYGTIRQIIPKERIIEINALEADFRKPR